MHSPSGEFYGRDSLHARNQASHTLESASLKRDALRRKVQLSTSATSEEWRLLLRQFDSDQDGIIAFHEFQAAGARQQKIRLSVALYSFLLIARATAEM